MRKQLEQVKRQRAQAAEKWQQEEEKRFQEKMQRADEEAALEKRLALAEEGVKKVAKEAKKQVTVKDTEG